MDEKLQERAMVTAINVLSNIRLGARRDSVRPLHLTFTNGISGYHKKKSGV